MTTQEEHAGLHKRWLERKLEVEVGKVQAKLLSKGITVPVPDPSTVESSLRQAQAHLPKFCLELYGRNTNGTPKAQPESPSTSGPPTPGSLVLKLERLLNPAILTPIPDEIAAAHGLPALGVHGGELTGSGGWLDGRGRGSGDGYGVSATGWTSVHSPSRNGQQPYPAAAAAGPGGSWSAGPPWTSAAAGASLPGAGGSASYGSGVTGGDGGWTAGAGVAQLLPPGPNTHPNPHQHLTAAAQSAGPTESGTVFGGDAGRGGMGSIGGFGAGAGGAAGGVSWGGAGSGGGVSSGVAGGGGAQPRVSRSPPPPSNWRPDLQGADARIDDAMDLVRRLALETSDMTHRQRVLFLARQANPNFSLPQPQPLRGTLHHGGGSTGGGSDASALRQRQRELLRRGATTTAARRATAFNAEQLEGADRVPAGAHSVRHHQGSLQPHGGGGDVAPSGSRRTAVAPEDRRTKDGTSLSSTNSGASASTAAGGAAGLSDPGSSGGVREGSLPPLAARSRSLGRTVSIAAAAAVAAAEPPGEAANRAESPRSPAGASAVHLRHNGGPNALPPLGHSTSPVRHRVMESDAFLTPTGLAAAAAAMSSGLQEPLAGGGPLQHTLPLPPLPLGSIQSGGADAGADASAGLHDMGGGGGANSGVNDGEGPPKSSLTVATTWGAAAATTKTAEGEAAAAAQREDQADAAAAKAAQVAAQAAAAAATAVAAAGGGKEGPAETGGVKQGTHVAEPLTPTTAGGGGAPAHVGRGGGSRGGQSTPPASAEQQRIEPRAAAGHTSASGGGVASGGAHSATSWTP